jgi:hypothetical protein
MSEKVTITHTCDYCRSETSTQSCIGAYEAPDDWRQLAFFRPHPRLGTVPVSHYSDPLWLRLDQPPPDTLNRFRSLSDYTARYMCPKCVAKLISFLVSLDISEPEPEAEVINRRKFKLEE